MKRFVLYIGIVAGLIASCSIQEENYGDHQQDDTIFYASFEQPTDEGTRVYANQDLYLRWTADDRVSIFNKNTYNQEYQFSGETGDNAGEFRKIESTESMTGNAISNVVSVYPYQGTTEINENETLTLTLPSEQHYAENTFGLGDNTMVSVSADNFLQYKNVGGYLRLSLYGEGVSISSITLKGNNGEKLAGKASVTMPLDGTPTAVLADDAAEEITLVCDTPVVLGATVEESKDFWFVVPPMTFSHGFTISVSQTNGGVSGKATSNSIIIERSKLSKMSAVEMKKATPSWAISFADERLKSKLVAAFDTDGDGELSYEEAAAVTSIEGVLTIKTYTSFDEFQYFTGVEVVPKDCFKDWAKLSSIVLPPNLVHIYSNAFSGCSNLKSITIPESVWFIDAYAFSSCSKLTEIVLPRKVSDILKYTFSDCTSLSSVSILGEVNSIGNYAFSGCSNLMSINLPESVTSIGNYAFSGCSSLPDIALPKNLMSIGGGAFSGCSNLATISSIPTGVSIINYATFSGCSSLTTIILPESINSIGDGAFQGCSSLSSINIPESVTSIGGTAFMNCLSLISISIPESVSSIGDWAFGCSGLISINIPDSVTSIGRMVLCGCDGLRSIIVNTENPIYDSRDNCNAIIEKATNTLMSACNYSTIPEGVEKIGDYAFAACSGIESINIPESVTNIGVRAFSECTGLKSITIPANIGGSAFSDCTSLSTVLFLESVTSIGEYVFSNCSNLSSITVLPLAPPAGNTNMFTYANNDAPIFVPSASVDTYKQATGWRKYASRIQAIQE